MRFKEVLVLVVGTTPQIITETICALAQQKPPIYIEKVYIITTAVGKKTAEERLLSKGLFQAFTREFKLDNLAIGGDDFIVVRDSVNREIADITSDKESEAVGDLITSLIRDLTNDPSVRLHCSIAGGRKTMSFYMGAALQLFGRPQDRLYHVLVTPEFESNPLFFYKPKRNKIIEARLPDGSIKKLNTKDAHIHLMELPFIRLRDKLLLKGKSFHDLVNEGQREIDAAAIQPELSVDLSARTVQIGHTVIEMVPAQLMTYVTLLKAKIEHCRQPEKPYCFECTDCFMTVAELSTPAAMGVMAGTYSRIYHQSETRREEFLAKYSRGMGQDIIRQNISKIKKSMQEQIGDQRLLPYFTVSNVRQWGSSRYGIRVEKGKIRIE